MDVLGKLIELCAIRGSLHVRCQAAGDYSVDHTESVPGEALFHMVLEGSCVVEPYGGASFLAEAGELIIFPKGAAHRLIHASPGSNQRHWMTRNAGLPPAELPHAGAVAELDLLCGRFHYDTTAAALLFDALPQAMHMRHSGCSEETPNRRQDCFASLFHLIRIEAEEIKPGALEIVTALTTALFVIALRQHFHTPPIDRGMIALLSDKSLAPSCMAMFADPSADWSVGALASLSNMSRSTFVRRYAAVAGKGPAEILLSIRCLLALKALRTTTLSIHGVANQVGYKSEAAFSKAFARKMGFTPALARRAPRPLVD